MNYLKFGFYLIFNIIKENVYKTIMLFLSLILMYNANFADDYNIYKVEKTLIMNDGTYVYVKKNIHNNKIFYDNICSDVPLKLINGNIYDIKYNDMNVVMWVISGILILILIVITISDNYCWNLKQIYGNTFNYFIFCDKINKTYKYHAFNKLILSTDSQFSDRKRLNHILKISSFNELNRCPKYKNKKYNFNINLIHTFKKL